MAILRLSILVSLAVGVLSAGAEEPKKPTPKFKLAKDTTFVLEPLDAEGYVDYEAALNKQLMGTTTPESNAVVLLMKCFGPKPDGKELHPDFYQALGIEAPPAEGEYLVEYYPFFKEVLKEDESRRDFLNLEYALRSKPWKPADSPRHAEWLKVNEKPLAQVHEALLRNDFILPLISRHRDGKKGMLAVGSSSVIRSLRDLGTLLPLRAMLRVGEGKTDEAIADVLVLYKLGRHTLRGATLSELNVGTALQAIAISTGMAVLEHGRPTALQALVLHLSNSQAWGVRFV